MEAVLSLSLFILSMGLILWGLYELNQRNDLKAIGLFAFVAAINCV